MCHFVLTTLYTHKLCTSLEVLVWRNIRFVTIVNNDLFEKSVVLLLLRWRAKLRQKLVQHLMNLKPFLIELNLLLVQITLWRFVFDNCIDVMQCEGFLCLKLSQVDLYWWEVLNGPNKSPLPIGEAKQPKDEVLIRVRWVEVVV